MTVRHRHSAATHPACFAEEPCPPPWFVGFLPPNLPKETSNPDSEPGSAEKNDEAVRLRRPMPCCFFGSAGAKPGFSSVQPAPGLKAVGLPSYPLRGCQPSRLWDPPTAD